MLFCRIRQRLGEKKGAVAVLMALALTTLLGVTALVVDVGMVYLHNLKVSNAVDAAALAGIQALPANPDLAYQLAESFALKNGVAPEDVNIQITADQRGINVQARKTVDYFFAQILGFSSINVGQSAGAKVENLSAVVGAVPLCIENQELIYNEAYLLKSGAGGKPDEAQHSGWFGALSLGGHGAKAYENNLKFGYQAELKVGDLWEIESGNMSGPTTRGIEYRLAQCKHTPACTSESFVRNCPCLVMVPVVQLCGKEIVKVQGFALFFLESVEGQGRDNNVWGKFLRLHLPGEITAEEAGDYGVYSSHLTY
ncbi:MAG: pilus assembly protein TadG-related protein [Clostridia bacterium]|nr:pilus assembly protein TadG-related protein [Clostridia bacterium]